MMITRKLRRESVMKIELRAKLEVRYTENATFLLTVNWIVM